MPIQNQSCNVPIATLTEEETDLTQKPDLSKINAAVKVSDLIFMLRSAFRSTDFNKVEEILVSREKTMSEEIGHWKRAYELMEKKHGEAMMGRLFVDEELSKCMRKLGELAGQVARLEEGKKLDNEKEILVAREKKIIEENSHLKKEYELMEKKLGEEMKGRLSIEEDLSKCKRELGKLADQVARLEEDKKLNLEKIKVSDEREKRACDMYKELLDDFERVKRENRDLVVKNTESESARVKTERELESVKKKNIEFDLRVTRLEREVELMMSQRREQSKVEEEKNSTTIASAKEVPFITKSENSSEPHVKEVICNGKENGSSSEGADYTDTRVNQLKEAGAGFVIHPCNEGTSIPRQTGGEKESSSPRDYLGEKCQKSGSTYRTIESVVVVEISDSDDEMPIQNQSCNVPIAAPTEEETENVVSRSTSGSKRNRSSFLGVGGRANGFINWSSSSSDSDSDSDGDSCDSVAINRIITQGKARKA